MSWVYPKQLPDAQLQKMAANRLLSLYRSVRTSTKVIEHYLCRDCGRLVYDDPASDECHNRHRQWIGCLDRKAKLYDGIIECHLAWKDYQDRVKVLLDRKEHVEKSL